MCGEIQAVVAVGKPSVEVEEIGVVFVHQFLGPVVPLLCEPGIQPAQAISGPSPIEPVVCMIHRVVRDAGQRSCRIGVSLIEGMLVKAVGEVRRDGKAEMLLGAGLLPRPDDVDLRAHPERVPGLVGGIIEIEVVVVDSHHTDKFRTAFPVECRQLGRIELVGLPERDEVLVTELRGMAEGLHVISVDILATRLVAREGGHHRGIRSLIHAGLLRFLLVVHVAAVVAVEASHGVEPPVHVDAELRIPEPVGTAVVCTQRLRIRLHGTVGNLEIKSRGIEVIAGLEIGIELLLGDGGSV